MRASIDEHKASRRLTWTKYSQFIQMFTIFHYFSINIFATYYLIQFYQIIIVKRYVFRGFDNQSSWFFQIFGIDNYFCSQYIFTESNSLIHSRLHLFGQQIYVFTDECRFQWYWFSQFSIWNVHVFKTICFPIIK